MSADLVVRNARLMDGRLVDLLAQDGRWTRIGGSLAATYLGQFLGWYQPGQSARFIGAIVGAVLLLGAYHLVTKK